MQAAPPSEVPPASASPPSRAGGAGLRPWTSRFTLQLRALTAKNWTLALRSPVLLLTKLVLSNACFLLLLLIVEQSLLLADSRNSRFQDVPNPEARYVGAIPGCDEDLYVSRTDSCYERVSGRVQRLEHGTPARELPPGPPSGPL